MQEFDSNHDFEKFNQLIKDMHIAMMATVAADGSLRSRPMAAQQLQPDGPPTNLVLCGSSDLGS